MTKKKVSQEVDSISLYNLEGKLADAIGYLQTIQDRYPTAYLDKEYDYDQCEYFSVKIDVEETDAQYRNRLKSEADAVQWRKRQYEQLKKEFE